MAFPIIPPAVRYLPQHLDQSQKTLASAINSYIAWRRPSHNDLRYLVKLKVWFGATTLGEIGQEAIDRAAHALYPGCSNSTLSRQVYVPVSTVMRHAGMNVPFRRPPQPRPQNRSIGRDEAEDLIAATYDPDLRALLIFLFFSGARLAEAIGLTPDRLDFERHRVRLHLGKRNIDVWRPLHRRASEALRQLPKRSDRVFRWNTTRGAHLALRRMRKKTGHHFTFHMARHSYATWLADEGVSLRDIMDAGGWASPKSAIIYIGSDETRVRRAINRL